MNLIKLFDLNTVLRSFLGRSEDEIKNYIKSPVKLNRNGAELATNHVALALSHSKLGKVKKTQILSGLMNRDLSTREVRLILDGVERVYKRMKGDEREFYRLKTIQLPCLTHLSVPVKSPNDHIERRESRRQKRPEKGREKGDGRERPTSVRYLVRYIRTPRPVTGETKVKSLEKQLKIERAKVLRLKRKIKEKRTAEVTSEVKSSTDIQHIQQKLELWQHRTEAANKSLADLQRKYNNLLSRDFQFFEEEVENAQHLTVEDVNKVTSQNTARPQITAEIDGFSSQIEQVDHIKLAQLEDIKLEQVEGITFEQLEDIKLEQEEKIKMEDTTVAVPANTMIRCGACGEYFFYEKYFLEHVQEHHRTPDV